MLIAARVRILPLIAVAGLLAGCQKQETYPSGGNQTPVNESAMPPPEASPSATESASPAESPGAPTPSPSPVPVAPSSGT